MTFHSHSHYRQIDKTCWIYSRFISVTTLIKLCNINHEKKVKNHICGITNINHQNVVFSIKNFFMQGVFYLFKPISSEGIMH